MAVWVAWGTCFAVRSPALVWEVCGCSADDTLRKFRHDLAGIEAARRKAQDDLDAAEEGVEELVANSELSSREKERVLASAMLDVQSLTHTIAALTHQVGRINGCVAAVQCALLAARFACCPNVAADVVCCARFAHTHVRGYTQPWSTPGLPLVPVRPGLECLCFAASLSHCCVPCRCVHDDRSTFLWRVAFP